MYQGLAFLPCKERVVGSIPTWSTKKNIYGMLGSPVTPPALGAGELASSNLAIPTKKYNISKILITFVL